METLKKFFFNNSAAIVVLLAFFAQQMGWITPEQAKKYKSTPPEKIAAAVEALEHADARENADPAAAISSAEIMELIRKAIAEALKTIKPPEPAPLPAPLPVPIVVPEPAPVVIPRPVTPPRPAPEPVDELRILLSDENGVELSTPDVTAGQLFRVSAIGAGEVIGWHAVKSGDVRLVASSDGKEFVGSLAAGQWVEFALTDYSSRTAAALRVRCLTAPIPPPITPAPAPKPGGDDTGPAGDLGLIGASRRGLSRVSSADRDAQADVIARAHLSAIAAADHDPFAQVSAMQKTVADEIGKAMTDEQKTAWKPWADEVSRAIERLQYEQKLTRIADWKAAFTEIAAGLKGGI
jgi:hypothetical protein